MNNYVLWRNTYEYHLMNLADIFVEGFKKIKGFENEYFVTRDFFEEFSQFIYNNSSKYVNKWVEKPEIK